MPSVKSGVSVKKQKQQIKSQSWSEMRVLIQQLIEKRNQCLESSVPKSITYWEKDYLSFSAFLTQQTAGTMSRKLKYI